MSRTSSPGRVAGHAYKDSSSETERIPYRYPAIPHVQHPPQAYAPQVRHNHPHPQPHPEHHQRSTPLHGSFSSQASAVSAASDYKQSHASRSYRLGSQAERGLIEGQIHRSSHTSPVHDGSRVSVPIRKAEMVEDNSAVFRYLSEQQISKKEDHAIWILFWLSCLDPFHSMLSAIFTLFAVVILVLTSPIRLCYSQCSFSTSLIRTIAPIFRNHLQMIYAPSVNNAHTFVFSPLRLVLVHLACPIISVGVAVAAWVAAAFWLFAIILGNPDGTERRDDGRAAVLSVRNWLERYLSSALV